jgi:hypothetical protein
VKHIPCDLNFQTVISNFNRDNGWGVKNQWKAVAGIPSTNKRRLINSQPGLDPTWGGWQRIYRLVKDIMSLMMESIISGKRWTHPSRGIHTSASAGSVKSQTTGVGDATPKVHTSVALNFVLIEFIYFNKNKYPPMLGSLSTLKSSNTFYPVGV